MNKFNVDRIHIDDVLSVRPITLDDTDNIIKWRNNPRVVNNFLYRATITPKDHIHWMNTKVASGNVLQFIILANDVPIGSVYFRDIDYEQMTAEYGIFIGEDEAAGLGYGKTLSKWAVEYCRNELKMKSLSLRVLADNTSAVKSYINAGYKCIEIKEDYIDGRDLLFMEIML